MENRRNFLSKVGAVAGLSLVADLTSGTPMKVSHKDKLGEILPQRQLTRNGEKVTSFCLGGYHLGFTENPKEAERTIERSIELGVRFFDNARKYNGGRSEEYMGKFLVPKYREHIFLMTKSPGKTSKEVRQHLDESLKALNTDLIDLWQIHALQTIADVDSRLKEGVLDVFLEAKEKGKARYLGFTGHANPKVHLHFLSKLDELGIELDACQMPLNVCDPSFESFQHIVLPVLLKKKYGVLAMKTMAGGSMMGGRIDTTPEDIKTKDIPDVVTCTDLSLANLHQYVYSLPVSSLISGCRHIYELEQNVEVLKKFKPLSKNEMQKLEEYARPYAGMIVENYKRIVT